MLIENIKRFYPMVAADGSAGMLAVNEGAYVRFSDAVEASSNSLHQLKAEILPLCSKGIKLYNEGETQSLDSLFERIAAKLSAI